MNLNEERNYQKLMDALDALGFQKKTGKLRIFISRRAKEKRQRF